MRVSARRSAHRPMHASAPSMDSRRLPRGLSCAGPIADSTLPLRSGVPDASPQGGHAVVREHAVLERIELGVVDVRLQHALLQVFEHYCPRLAAERAKRGLVQFAQAPAARIARDKPHRLSAEAERPRESPVALELAGLGIAEHRDVATVDLHLLTELGRDPRVGIAGGRPPQLAHGARRRLVSGARRHGRRRFPARSHWRFNLGPTRSRAMRGAAFSR